MQSMFRLPWTREPGGDRHFPVDNVLHYKTQQMKPNLDLSFAINQKRKRADSLGLSSPDALQLKRQRNVDDGAVQPVVNICNGSETASLPLVPAAVQRKSTAIESNAQAPTAASVASSNVPAQALPLAAATGHAMFISASTTSPESTLTSKVPDAINMDTQPIASESIDSNLDHVRSIVDAQINLEILLKHNELRLIEQELAKCQVALEQIRRCELIPFPGSQSASVNVSQGVGASLRSQSGFTTPKHPAPFGVTDGPYARHYTQWLLHDPMFESQPTSAGFTGYSSMPSRSGRVSTGDFAPPTPIARTSRVSSGQKNMLAQDSSQTYRDPLLMKREQDNQWVRLICTKCKPERSNFQNIQGFLNHCRISHQDNYKSHEAAAIACGRIVDVDEATMPPPAPVIPKQRHSINVSTAGPHVFKTSNSLASTPTIERPQDRGSVGINPLVLSLPSDAARSKFRQLVLPRTFDPSAPKPEVTTPNVESPFGTPFTASPQTPYLSALLKRKHEVGDLQAAVAQAKIKVDTSAYDFSDNEDGANSKRSKQRKSGSGASRKPQNRTAGKGKEGSKKPTHAAGAMRMSTIPTGSAPVQSGKSLDSAQNSSFADLDGDDDMDHSMGASDVNPGLVSDNEGESDDADEDAENGASPPLPSAQFGHHASGLPRERASANSCSQNELTHLEIRDSSDGELDLSDAIHRSLSGNDLDSHSARTVDGDVRMS